VVDPVVNPQFLSIFPYIFDGFLSHVWKEKNDLGIRLMIIPFKTTSMPSILLAELQVDHTRCG
jgi:hypothetical protein